MSRIFTLGIMCLETQKSQDLQLATYIYSLEFWRLKEHDSQFPASSSLRVEDQYPILKIFWEEENVFLGSSFVQNLNKLGEAPHFAKGCELYSTQWFKWKPHLK